MQSLVLLGPSARKINPVSGSSRRGFPASHAWERRGGMIHLERQVEDIPEQPIKPLLMVPRNRCASSKPISRLSEAEITGALAVQDKLAKSEMQAILFYITASGNRHESRLFSHCCLMCGYSQENAPAPGRPPGTEKILNE